jgi:hypothetical protein
MQRRVVTFKFTDVSEVRTASIISLMIETVSTSETSVHSNQTTRRYISQDSELHTRRHENMKSHKLMFVMVTGCVLFEVRREFLNII